VTPADEYGRAKVGDKIRLNATAADWTQGKVFTVREVKEWGVICEWADLMGGLALYRAKWDQIEVR
jgi:hypothetical protein